MTRDQMVEAASREAAGVILFSPIENKGDIRSVSDQIAERILDAVEPLIRADERERAEQSRYVWVPSQREILADLRAKVEALPGNDPFQNPVRRDAYEYAIKDVLTLIDGDSDE